MSRRRPQQPVVLETRPTEEEVRATVERTVDSVRQFLTILIRLAGPSAGEPKP